MLANAGAAPRPAMPQRARRCTCLARSSSSEYPSSSWPRARQDASLSVQVRALSGTLARDVDGATAEELSDADLIERRRLLEDSYLAATAPEPVRRVAHVL